MKKIDKKKQQILMHLAVVPISSGQQLESLFSEYKQPEKRLSSCLRELEQEGLIEGKLQPIGESKIWRLSKNGRDVMDVSKHPVPLNNRNIAHYLALSSVYYHLAPAIQLDYFEVEPRFPYWEESGESKLYCPDILLVWGGTPYFFGDSTNTDFSK